MYLGYQKNKEGQEFIAAVKDTKEELEAIKYIKFTKIVESKEDYIMYEGTYITATEYEAIKHEQDKEDIRTQMYELDLRAIRPLRAILAGTSTQEDIDILLQIEGQVEELRTQLRQKGDTDI